MRNEKERIGEGSKNNDSNKGRTQTREGNETKGAVPVERDKNPPPKPSTKNDK